MKITVKTIAGISAHVVPITKAALTIYARAIAGKTVIVEIEPTSTLGDLIDAVKLEASLEAPLEIHEYQVYKDGNVVKESSLAACGIGENSQVSIKFVHKTS